MNVSGPLHVAILVSDLEASKRFYGGILGLEQKPRPNFDTPGAWYQLGGLELHLILTARQSLPAGEKPETDYHLALAVEDHEVTKRELKDAGVPYKESSVPIKQIFIRDPDGYLIELQSM
jgi:catechol 2,3-dioxygenase-like lactoylglutathione lyase family enzyme